MITEIDEKLELFFTKESSRYRDYTIWKEMFDIAISYEESNPAAYQYEVKRLRDLKNVYDYAREQSLLKAKGTL